MTDEGKQLELIGPDRPGLCLWCDRPATHACDAVLGLNLDNLLKPKGYGCDLPMCSRHAHRRGHIRFSRRRDGVRGDTIDYCPVHLDMERYVSAPTRVDLTPAIAEEMRVEIKRRVALDLSIGMKGIENGET